MPETAQLSSLEQVALDIYASLDPAATIEAITRSSQRALGADRSTTYVSDEFGRIEAVHTTECITVIRRYLETAIQRPLEDTWVWATLAAQPDPVLAVEDVGATFGEPFRKRLGAKSFAGVRLEARGLTGDEVELLGSIFCAFRERHVFTAQEISALRMLGAIGSLALSNARMFAKTRRGLDEATARAEADAAFRLMTENSRDVIARCDADGTIRYMSPASLDVLGLEPDSAAGRHLPSLLGLASVDDLASEGAVVSRLPGAGEIWVETRARRVKTAPHTLEIQTATRDVTLRQIARNELRAVAAEQAALRRVASLAAAEMPDDEVWSQMTSELADLVGPCTAWLLRVDGDGAEVMGASTGPGPVELHVGQRFSYDELGPMGRVHRTRGSSRRIDRDGPLGTAGCLVTVTPLVIRASVWGLLGVTHRVLAPRLTERHLESFGEVAIFAAQTLNARRERTDLEGQLRHSQKLEAVGQLAAGIAHEINTPIQFVGDSVEFLRDAFNDTVALLERYRALAETAATLTPEDVHAELEAADDDADLGYLLEQVPKAIDRTLDGANRVGEIVRAMKDFAHPRRDSMAPADLNRAVESTCTVARNEIKYVADIEYQFDPNLPPVTCHLGDINQVFLNLVINAAHAIGERAASGGPERGTITVASRLSEAGTHAILTVTDTGTGIPEGVRERIFEPFFTTKDVGRGTGQGLAIAARVCEAHGGSLSFRTEMGAGTTFTVRLPVAGVDPEGSAI